MPTLTVYTPTYNRADLLPRVYESLCRQTCTDFEWLIVDDGSIDGTKDLVQEWISENKIKISYIYKENGGVHTARDVAYQAINTELLCSIDSDDMAVDDMVENIIKFWTQKGSNEFAGIYAPVHFINESTISTSFPQTEAMTYQDFTFKYNYKADKHSILRTNIIKLIPKSPIFSGEKLVAEGWKWIQLPELPFLILQTPTLIVDYQNTGYSKNARKNMFNNLNGFRETKRQYIMHSKYVIPRIKGYIGYIIASVLLKDSCFIKNSPRPIITFLLTPLGFIGYLYVITRWKKYRVKK